MKSCLRGVFKPAKNTAFSVKSLWSSQSCLVLLSGPSKQRSTGGFWLFVRAYGGVLLFQLLSLASIVTSVECYPRCCFCHLIPKVEPALWLWAPDDGRDRPWRKFQHLYWPLPFSLTFLLWRIGSVKTAISQKLKLEVRTDRQTTERRAKKREGRRQKCEKRKECLGGRHAGVRTGTPRWDIGR